ncbi:TPA: DUF1433 domain-containing protein [Staphylococcus aureus]|nr:DUF1433 domain-containing protein [Staphylococcus aureus]
MKKKYILIIVSVILIGMIVIAYAHNKQKKDHYIETQEKRIDLFFKYNLNHYKSLKVTRFKKSPMDSYFIGGYINNNKDYEFQAFINVGGRKQFQRDIGYDEEKLGKLLKEQEIKNWKTVDQIIKNEHLDKSEYEAEPPLFLFSGSLD